MESKELRIGNYLQYLSGDIFKVSHYDIKIIAEWDANRKLCAQPIPLTEEWLLKMGFNKSISGIYSKGLKDIYELGAIRINLHYGRFDFHDFTILLYVHQLQNLYFALTGEELIIKP